MKKLRLLLLVLLIAAIAMSADAQRKKKRRAKAGTAATATDVPKPKNNPNTPDYFGRPMVVLSVGNRRGQHSVRSPGNPFGQLRYDYFRTNWLADSGSATRGPDPLAPQLTEKEKEELEMSIKMHEALGLPHPAYWHPVHPTHNQHPPPPMMPSAMMIPQKKATPGGLSPAPRQMAVCPEICRQFESACQIMCMAPNTFCPIVCPDSSTFCGPFCEKATTGCAKYCSDTVDYCLSLCG